MNNRQKAEEYYQYFSGLEGNQHIASLFAIEKILDIIEFNKPKRILEVGLGIGSIAYSIIDFLTLKDMEFEYCGTESNPFCLEKLPENLNDYFRKILIFSSLEEMGSFSKFDFVIVDGLDDAIEKVRDLISFNGVIFIEGDRSIQQNHLSKIFPNSWQVHLISIYHEPNYGPFTTGHWSGGGKLIYINPTYPQKLNWVREKLKSAFRNRVTRHLLKFIRN